MTTQKTPVLQSQVYFTHPRTRIDFRGLQNYLKSREIPCLKLNYSLASLVQNKQHQFATLQLTSDGNRLKITNLKVKEYQNIESRFNDLVDQMPSPNDPKNSIRRGAIRKKSKGDESEGSDSDPNLTEQEEKFQKQI